MNIFFINITENWNLKPYQDSYLTDINEITSNFDNLKKIKESFLNMVSGDLNFQEVVKKGRILKKK